MAPFTKIHRPSVGGNINIAYLTDDLLINILSRLPLKSLLRFKCVSKAWQLLISDSFLQRILPTPMSGLIFSDRYRNNCPVERVQYAFITDKTHPTCNNSPTDIGNLSFFPRHRELYTVDCCNGLLLGLHRQDIYSTPVYYVINPATKKWAELPAPAKERPHTTHRLAFDPRISPHYTLICSGSFTGVDIFSSKTGVWVQSKVPQPLVIRHWRRSAGPMSVLFNRTLHMLSEGDSIVGFDVDGECFRLIPLPVPMPTDCRECRQRCLGVFGGHLYYANHDGVQLQIWILEDYDERKWALKHKTKIDCLVEKHPQAICSSALYKGFCGLYEIREGGHLPFWLADDGIIVETGEASQLYYLREFSVLAFHPDLEVVFLGMGDTVLSYNLNSMKLEEVWVSKPQYNGLHSGNVYPFSPCLVDFYNCKKE
ncbi:F-box protein At5g07610-like [Magnolia sinica]|uniref:F-box protein At5g07610-like n=1 Tax=Magnolia sinica TaxID=86752 RepID=UPI0026586CD8|nr:F-box protein At5g07610-like [Magnolia sinica]